MTAGSMVLVARTSSYNRRTFSSSSSDKCPPGTSSTVEASSARCDEGGDMDRPSS
eukprot:CAMPEP_0204558242 /NCGR_PEP_ID=MMETSP0661-20131031/30946_1 /ASSEMBLY_ACC=CAM_ASM_000606 /TAXON_ID=109239 /ORGANISM="Alexandrium margalefi, Strain AMGDE01CS-322" /LENGTH=54 /DNA_ID=CAMNT_0051565407 /DNA_START=78 /DNA_END=239 /DNA_ORIENTATION=-